MIKREQDAEMMDHLWRRIDEMMLVCLVASHLVA